MIVGHHKREASLEAEFRSLRFRCDALWRGKAKLILRSISDRIEEMAICAVLNISRDEMRARRLFKVEKLETSVGKTVTTESGTQVVITLQHATDVRDDLQREGLRCREVARGRQSIKDLGDIEAHEDPTPYLPAISIAIKDVFGNDKAKVQDAEAVVKTYLRLRRHYGYGDVECDISNNQIGRLVTVNQHH